MNLLKVDNVVINLDHVIGVRFYPAETTETESYPSMLKIITSARNRTGESDVTVFTDVAAEKAWIYITGKAHWA